MGAFVGLLAALDSDESDVEGLAELTFWAGRLGIRTPALVDFSKLPVASLPWATLTQLSLAFAEPEPEMQSEFLRLYGDLLRIRFQEETDSLILTEDEETVTAEFIVSFDLLSDLQEEAQPTELIPTAPEGTPIPQLSARGKGKLGGILNEEAVRRVEILRSLFPRKESYCTQGHGHHLTFGGIDLLPHDSTVKRMPSTAIPVYWLVRVNSILHGLQQYENRPPTWRQFAEMLMSIRKTVAACLIQLHRSIASYFEGNRARSLFDGALSAELWTEAKKESNNIPHLPRTAVDEWGLSSEGQRTGSGKVAGFSVNIASGFSLRRYQPLAKAIHDYLFGLARFFSQAEMICVVHGIIGRNPKERDRVRNLASERYDYSEDNIRLSTYNLFQAMLCLDSMQLAFDEWIGDLVKSDDLKKLKRREGSLFPELWALWYQFAHFPEKRLQSAGAQSLSAMEFPLTILRDAVKVPLLADLWSAVIISEKFPWKGRPALVLRLDLAYLEDLEAARVGVIARLAEILASAKHGSLSGYALEFFYSHLLVIPAFHGIALDPGAWVIPAFVFLGDHESPDRPWLRPLHPLSQTQIQLLGVEINPTSRDNAISDLVKELSELQLRFHHIALLAEQAKRLDAVGIGILERYLADMGRRLGQGLNRVQELLPEVISQTRRSATQPQEVLGVLLQPLERLQEELASLGSNAIIGLQECEARAEQLQEVVGFASVLRFMMVSGAGFRENSVSKK